MPRYYYSGKTRGTRKSINRVGEITKLLTMKKLIVFALALIATVIVLVWAGSFSTLDAQNKKKSKKEQKWELEHKAFIEKTTADLASGAVDPNRKDGEMTWLGGVLPNYYDGNALQDLELARLLINAKGIKINAWNILLRPNRSWHFTALMTAVSSPELVNLLIDKGASVNMQDSWTDWQGKVVDGGNTPLMIAIGVNNEESFVESAKILIDRGTNIELKNWYGNSAVMLSVHNTEIAKILIDMGAKLDVINVHGLTALMLAAPKYSQVVKLLIDKGANIKLRQDPKFDFTQNALDFAALSGNIESAKLILARATTLGIKEEILRCALHFAVLGNQVEMAKYLIDQEGAKTETYSATQKMTPLMETSMFEMVQLLIERGANVNANNNSMYTPFYQSIANFKKPDLKVKDNEKILNLLIEKGANVDFPVVGGVTPLMGAVEKIEPTKILIEKGAKIDLQNSNGETALMYAVKGGFLKLSIFKMPVTGSFAEAVKLLLEKGADVNIQDKWGKTALMHAAGGVNAQGDKYSTYTEAMEMLIEKGAKIDVLDKEGHTALYWAQKYGRTKSAELLLAKGANPSNKYDKAADKSNVKAGIIGTWTNTSKVNMAENRETFTMTNKLVFNTDWSYSKSMIVNGQLVPDGAGYNTYDLRDGKIWVFNKMGTSQVFEYRFEGKTLILNGEKYTKSGK